MRQMISIVLLVLLAGCTTTTITNKQTPKNLSQTHLNTETGILIGAFGRTKNGPGYHYKSVKFRNIDTGQIYSIEKSMQVSSIYSYFNKKPDFSSETYEGDIFAFTLPLGQYTIYGFEIVQNNSSLGYNETWSSKMPFSIPFEVSANKVNYLGNFNFIGSYVKGVLGVDVHKGGHWVLSDKLEQDILNINNTYPNIPTNGIVSVVPSEKEIFTPFILFETEIQTN